jgi:hypothetical protein
MPSKVNCALAWGNHIAGRLAQNGGSRAAPLDISAGIVLFIVPEPCWFVLFCSCCSFLVRGSPCKFCNCVMYCWRRFSSWLLSIIHVVLSGSPICGMSCVCKGNHLLHCCIDIYCSRMLYTANLKNWSWLENNTILPLVIITHNLHHHYISPTQSISVTTSSYITFSRT